MIDADVVEDPLESTGGVATHHRHDPDEFETRLHREGRPVHEPDLHLAPALAVLVALIGVERPQLVALPPLGPLRQPLLGASTRARCIDRAAVFGPEAFVEVGSAGAAPVAEDGDEQDDDHDGQQHHGTGCDQCRWFEHLHELIHDQRPPEVEESRRSENLRPSCGCREACPRPKPTDRAAAAWSVAAERLVDGSCDLVVLDELGLALAYGWLELDEVVSRIRERARHTNVIITAPEPPPLVLDLADTITTFERTRDGLGRPLS